MDGVIILGLAALLSWSVWYVFKTLAVAFLWKRLWPKFFAYAITVSFSHLTVLLFATSADALLGNLYLIGGFICVAHFWLCMSLLLVQLLGHATPFSSGAKAYLSLAATLLLMGVGAWKGGKMAVLVGCAIPVAGLQEEIRVMHISDLHLGRHRGQEDLERIVQLTNQEAPDLILITGDLVDSDAALTPKVLSHLTSFHAPTFYVPGNHETYLNFDQAMKQIRAQGVRVLLNEVVMVNGIQIVGLDYLGTGDFQSGIATICLHHSPIEAECAKDSGVDLMVAGHTHGGQIFPFTVLADVINKFNNGLYELDGMQIFVSQGAGTFFARMRLGSANQVDLLRLFPANQDLK
jgi:uncharacterized protein